MIYIAVKLLSLPSSNKQNPLRPHKWRQSSIMNLEKVTCFLTNLLNRHINYVWLTISNRVKTFVSQGAGRVCSWRWLALPDTDVHMSSLQCQCWNNCAGQTLVNRSVKSKILIWLKSNFQIRRKSFRLQVLLIAAKMVLQIDGHYLTYKRLQSNISGVIYIPVYLLLHLFSLFILT